jgi:hypothetical protein
MALPTRKDYQQPSTIKAFCGASTLEAKLIGGTEIGAFGTGGNKWISSKFH